MACADLSRVAHANRCAKCYAAISAADRRNRDSVEGYYEDSVTLLCLLVMSGNFLGVQGLDAAALFADGFESGDTSAWSTVVP